MKGLGTIFENLGNDVLMDLAKKKFKEAKIKTLLVYENKEKEIEVKIFDFDLLEKIKYLNEKLIDQNKIIFELKGKIELLEFRKND